MYSSVLEVKDKCSSAQRARKNDSVIYKLIRSVSKGLSQLKKKIIESGVGGKVH